MSLYKSASLAMIPTAYKDGKLYSVRPTDGSGDFTFTRGSNLSATRISASQLIEKGRENLLLQSNQFDTTWGNTNTTETSGQSGYDGSSDAWLLTKTAAFGQINQSISLSGVHTFSFYAKEGTSGWMRMVLIGTANPSAYFNLSNGNVGVTSNIISSNSENIGGGWYRYSISINQPSITVVRIYPAEGDNDISGTSGNILIQDAQLEKGLVATDVIETTTTTGKAGILENTPRFDYSGGATCPSLLLEPSRTNLILQSEYFGGSEWTKGNSTITSNTSISPQGTQNATTLTITTAVGNIYENVSGSGDYTFSVFAKYVDMQYIRLRSTNSYVYFDIQNGSVVNELNGTGSVEDFGNGWYRCSVTGNNTNSLVQIFLSDTTGTPTGTGSALIFGAQCEAGSYPTSYIPTYGVSQTRAQDICNKTGISSLIGQTEGTIYNEINFSNTSGVAGAWSISNGSSANRITMNTIGVNATYFTLSIAQNYNSGSTKLLSANVTYGANHKVAIKYSSTTMKLFIDGQLSGSVSTDGFGNYANFYIGANQTGVGGETRNFKESILFPTALSDSELATLTTI